jgi:hypothetical protein
MALLSSMPAISATNIEFGGFALTALVQAPVLF